MAAAGLLSWSENFAWKSFTSWRYKVRVAGLTRRRRRTPCEGSSPLRIGAVRAAASAALLLSFFGRRLVRRVGSEGADGASFVGNERGRHTASCESCVAAVAGAVADGEGNGVFPLGARANGGSRWQQRFDLLRGADGAEPEGVDLRLAQTAPPTARSGISKGAPEDVAEFETIPSRKGRFPAPLP
jgi:hypothetical protein